MVLIKTQLNRRRSDGKANLFAGVQMVLVSLRSFDEDVVAPVAALHGERGRRVLRLHDRSRLLELAVMGDPVLEK